MRRVFVDWLDGESAGVEGARAHHLARVVRLRVGERVEASDHERLFEAEAEAVSGKRVTFRLLGPREAPATGPRIELSLAVIKFPRFELALEKLTELGADAIVPVAAERSDKGLVRAAAKRTERWRAIVEEAAQQARRMAPPEVAAPASLAEALARPAEQRILLDFEAPPLRECVRPGPATLLVGPEGGWAAEERRAALATGAVRATLGPTVLRAETAAIAAASAVSALQPRLH